MRAVLCSAFSDPPQLMVGEIPVPSPGPGEVRVRVRAAGVNFADTLMVRGKYQSKPEFPFVPGMELAGEIDGIGAGVSGFAPGDRVLGTLEHGAFAEFAVVRALDCAKIPAAMDYAIAATFPVVYGTAHGGLAWRANLRSDETLLVLGAAGGVGLAAVEVGKAMGAYVLAAAGGADRGILATQHGADAAIDYVAEDLRETVLKITQNKGVDVVFDPVGGPAFDAMLRASAWQGRIVVVGFASGHIPQIPANLLLVKNIAALGLFWGAYRKHDPARVRESLETLLGWWEEGKLKPLVSERFALADAGRAFAHLSERRGTGKIVIEVG
ncbi:MAG: NADPH:quinone oxidoreductase family protein [Proteobacteria bacterium]|nr:NADPH:quinone oxidoreductase family protein [Pseudomonadota bacterium]